MVKNNIKKLLIVWVFYCALLQVIGLLSGDGWMEPIYVFGTLIFSVIFLVCYEFLKEIKNLH